VEVEAVCSQADAELLVDAKSAANTVHRRKAAVDVGGPEGGRHVPGVTVPRILRAVEGRGAFVVFDRSGSAPDTVEGRRGAGGLRDRGSSGKKQCCNVCLNSHDGL